MIRIIRIWRSVLAGGALAIALGGCGKSNEPVAAVTPAPTPVTKPEPKPDPVLTPATTPAPKPPDETKLTVPPVVETGPKPSFASEPKSTSGFAPPMSATFNPPPAAPTNPIEAFEPQAKAAPQPPAPQVPAPQPPVATPPANKPPEQVKPDPTLPGEAGKLDSKPKEPTYPTEINGHDLIWYLKEISWRTQPDPQMREAAVRTIPAFGPTARRPALKPVTNVIYDDPDPGVRIAAITIVSNMGLDLRSEVKESITAILTAMRNSGKGDALRMYSVRSISSFGPDAVSAVKDLRSIANDPSWETRLAIAEALGSIGSPAKADADPSLVAAETLMKYLVPDKCMAVRLEAVKSLLTIGPPRAKTPEEYKKEIKPYLDMLEKQLEHEKGKYGDKGVYVWLLLLQIMYDDRTMADNIKKIAKMIETPEGSNAPLVRLYALQALGVLGKPAAPAVPQIIPALSYPEPPLQLAAMMTLARIGNEARAAVPELEKIKAKPPEKPAGAAADAKPDDSLQKAAADTIDYITGKKRFEDAKPDEKKDDKGTDKGTEKK